MTLATRAAKEVARAVSPRRTRTPRRSRDGESPSTSQHVERRVSRRLTRTPKESQTGVTQELELTDEHFVITWGITKEEEVGGLLHVHRGGGWGRGRHRGRAVADLRRRFCCRCCVPQPCRSTAW